MSARSIVTEGAALAALARRTPRRCARRVA
jgi:hypothetical protein